MSVPHKIYNLILRLVNVNKAVMKNSYLISVSHKTYFPITRPVRVNVTTIGSMTTVPAKIRSQTTMFVDASATTNGCSITAYSKIFLQIMSYANAGNAIGNAYTISVLMKICFPIPKHVHANNARRRDWRKSADHTRGSPITRNVDASAQRSNLAQQDTSSTREHANARDYFDSRTISVIKNKSFLLPIKEIMMTDYYLSFMGCSVKIS